MAEVNILQRDEWQIEEDLVLKEEKVYVSKNKALRTEIIWLYYNVPIAGYKGRSKITELVTRNYQQPGVTRNVRKYVNRYNKIEMPTEKLKLSEVPEKLLSSQIVDLVFLHFHSPFHFLFDLFLYFSIFRTQGQGQ